MQIYKNKQTNSVIHLEKARFKYVFLAFYIMIDLYQQKSSQTLIRDKKHHFFA